MQIHVSLFHFLNEFYTFTINVHLQSDHPTFPTQVTVDVYPDLALKVDVEIAAAPAAPAAPEITARPPTRSASSYHTFAMSA